MVWLVALWLLGAVVTWLFLGFIFGGSFMATNGKVIDRIFFGAVGLGWFLVILIVPLYFVGCVGTLLANVSGKLNARLSTEVEKKSVRNRKSRR